MSQLYPLANQRLRLLVYLEWILLACTVPTILLSQLHPWRPSIMPLFSTIALALLGWAVPKQRSLHKLLYTLLELVIILLPILLDQRLRLLPLLGFLPLLCFAVVVRGCRMFSLKGRLAVAGTTLLVFFTILLTSSVFPKDLEGMLRPPPNGAVVMPVPPEIIHLGLKLNSAITFMLGLAFALLLINALLAESQSREQLWLAHDQLRQYARRIEDQATLQERNRIAREIHDSLGHLLTAQSIQLENALLFLPKDQEKTRQFLDAAKQLAAQSLKGVRQSVAMLRSDPLQGQSLDVAIAESMEAFQLMSGHMPELTVKLSQSLPTEINTAIYRILQEALTNIFKHSQATHVYVSLQDYDATVWLDIEDNGVGFEPNQNTTGFGLQSMQERTLALDGQFYLKSSPGKGCCVSVSLPFRRSV